MKKLGPLAMSIGIANPQPWVWAEHRALLPFRVINTTTDIEGVLVFTQFVGDGWLVRISDRLPDSTVFSEHLPRFKFGNDARVVTVPGLKISRPRPNEFGIVDPSHDLVVNLQEAIDEAVRTWRSEFMATR
jgi:hypothetical protein